MTRNDVVLAALAPAEGSLHSPVQVQKLLFLLDEVCPDALQGPHFAFEPHSYGPFDANVYRALEQLRDEGLAVVRFNGRWQDYGLTPKGQKTAEQIKSQLPATTSDYIARASEFVRTLSFSALVASIYEAFPHMRENSVFVDVG